MMMENMEVDIKKKYLPIGTVVLLKGGTRKVMVMGFRARVTDENNNGMKDTVCFYKGLKMEQDKTITRPIRNKYYTVVNYGYDNYKLIDMWEIDPDFEGAYDDQRNRKKADEKAKIDLG